MYPEFAYSRAMQIILAGISFFSAYIFIYYIANLILQLYGEKAPARQKSIFALLVGVMLDSVWVYSVYLIGGMQSFSDTTYLLVVTSNPVFALLYYLIGTKVLKLSPVRSIKLMGYVYMYFISVKSLSRLIGSVFFVQQPGPYNYMLDAFSRIAFLFVFLMIILVTRYALRRFNHVIELRDNLFINLNKEIVIYFIKATAIYLFSVAVPLLVKERIAANVFVFIVFILCMVLTILGDLYKAARNKSENNLAHISSLSKDIPSTYMGDIADLSKRFNENPSLVSILLNKVDYAEKMKVKMNISLQSRLGNLYINNSDICLAVSCLLDNAIEAAANSRQKNVSLAIESKGDDGKLIVINNTTAIPVDTEKIVFHGITTKAKHQGEGGMAVVRKIASKYGNCTFQLSYYDYMVTAYFEIRQN